MGERYAECCRHHTSINGERDGCQGFIQHQLRPTECVVCGCLPNFHRKVFEYKTEVVYTSCKKIHDYTNSSTVDGCPQFTPRGGDAGIECAACGCHKIFHQDKISTIVTS
ncbi:hypothetical protein ABFX02_10G119700 [Erythranthe guttata]